MKQSNGVILLDTFQLRQETIIHHIKPKTVPYTKVFGVRQNENPAGYMDSNRHILEIHKRELIKFLSQHPGSDIITNYYFAILPETWQFIQENRDNIKEIFLVTCQDDFYTTYAQPNNYPIKPKNIIAYSDDHGRWKDDLQYALKRA